MSEQLPKSSEVNIAAFSRLLSDTTNSYKYIFLLSILDILKRRKFDVSNPVSFRELVVEMLANAWYPHTYFKLSFGAQDKIIQNLESLTLESQSRLGATNIDKKALRELISTNSLDKTTKSLLRYVPFRLLVPFLEHEIQSIPNRTKSNDLDRAIPEIAANAFETQKPFYCFNSLQYSECHSVVFHPDWIAYLEKHYSIVMGWASWQWLGYMQRRNPSTPGIINKLFAPTKRRSLSKQSHYWNVALSNTDFRCIYTGRELKVEKFSLDHYLPWSFITHDQLWNLVPTFPEINSSKSNNLPPQVSFNKFVEAHHKGIIACHQKMSQREWVKKTEPYIQDLGIQRQSDLLDLEQLKIAYSRVVPPLITLASNQGFKTWNPPFAEA